LPRTSSGFVRGYLPVKQCSGYTFHGTHYFFVLPYPDDSPAQIGQTSIGVTVALKVGLDLRPPPLGVIFRPSPVGWAAMPEAAVDEDRNPLSGKDNIDRPTATLKQPNVHPKPEPAPVQGGAQRQLQRVVAPPGH
jgi:hypothetical protein